MDELNSVCEQYGTSVINPHKNGFDENCILNGASASCIIRVGRDIFFDNSDFLKPEQSKWIKENVCNDRVSRLSRPHKR